MTDTPAPAQAGETFTEARVCARRAPGADLLATPWLRTGKAWQGSQPQLANWVAAHYDVWIERRTVTHSPVERIHV